ncbi:MAG TPA: class I SAM-dependent methyltransferase [Polyangiaceae bacterium]|nr:class I SAM-dependent methyltransferase [Polyangiaceae bacterium]
MTAANVAGFYDRVWDAFGELDRDNPAAYHRRRLILALVREHARSANQVLEVGCGQGALLKKLELELPAAVVHGADVSPRSLEKSRALGARAELFELDLSALDFEARHAPRFGYFDLVICSEVLEHLADDALALSRIGSLLAPGGHLIVTVPSGQKTRFDVAIGHVRHYTRAGLADLLRHNGYDVERAMAWGFPFHNLYRRLVAAGARLSLGAQGERGLAPPSGALGLGYRALARVLKPLYFLNRPYWGPQLLAVARKR